VIDKALPVERIARFKSGRESKINYTPQTQNQRVVPDDRFASVQIEAQNEPVNEEIIIVEKKKSNGLKLLLFGIAGFALAKYSDKQSLPSWIIAGVLAYSLYKDECNG